MIVKNCTLIKPLSCTASATAVDVAKILRDAKQRRAIVVDAAEKPVGIVSTTDINNRVVAAGKDAAKITAKEIMSKLHMTCDIDAHVAEIYSQMMEHKSYFCPATKAGKLYGVLTYGEVARCIDECLKGGDHGKV